MLRFYDPIAGAIHGGDTDLREMPLDSWRQKIAPTTAAHAVLRDIFYNIAYGANEPTQAAVEAAAQITEFIQTLPGATRAIWGRGEALRRTANASLWHAPLSDGLLLLDEAASALDTESEWHGSGTRKIMGSAPRSSLLISSPR